MKFCFYSKEKLGDEWWIFKLEHLADVLLKMNEVNLSLQRKQWTVVVAHDKC